MTATAHPRSRGENICPCRGTVEGTGSSPLTRGKPPNPAKVLGRRGLIPAHAGKTRPKPQRRRAERAHPRSRGENRVQARRTRLGSGSSPLTRGKHLRATAGTEMCGLIPAHAGKTTFRGASGRRGWAHPRSRGENADTRARRYGTPGSSPLTRGKPTRDADGRTVLGLIPAHAGKTPVG